MQDKALRAASVASQVAGGCRQLSQLPQGRLCFAEVVQQPHPAAVVRLGQGQQGVELAALQALELFGRLALVDHAALVHHVGQAVGHPGVGRQAVAAGAAGFLVVALDVFRQVQVRDETHVGFVDAHAEGDGGHHHQAFFAQKTVLVAAAHVAVQAGVVGQRGDPLGHQPVRPSLPPCAGSGSRRCRRRPRVRRAGNAAAAPWDRSFPRSCSGCWAGRSC